MLGSRGTLKRPPWAGFLRGTEDTNVEHVLSWAEWQQPDVHAWLPLSWSKGVWIHCNKWVNVFSGWCMILFCFTLFPPCYTRYQPRTRPQPRLPLAYHLAGGGGLVEVWTAGSRPVCGLQCSPSQPSPAQPSSVQSRLAQCYRWVEAGGHSVVNLHQSLHSAVVLLPTMTPSVGLIVQR